MRKCYNTKKKRQGLHQKLSIICMISRRRGVSDKVLEWGARGGKRGPNRGLGRLSAEGTRCGGTGAETAAIILHEDDSDRGATKRMACQRKWERIVSVFRGKRTFFKHQGAVLFLTQTPGPSLQHAWPLTTRTLCGGRKQNVPFIPTKRRWREYL